MLEPSGVKEKPFFVSGTNVGGESVSLELQIVRQGFL